MSLQENRSLPGIALDKQASAEGSSELGKKWWHLLLELQALQRAHSPADTRKIGGHPPLSSWNFPSCWRNLQIEFKSCGCWCCALGRDMSGFRTGLVWGRFGMIWGVQAQNLCRAVSTLPWHCPPKHKPTHRAAILHEWKWSTGGWGVQNLVFVCWFVCWHHESHPTKKKPH